MSKPLSADLREKLHKLLPLLGSNQPGEVQAAVAAIGRALTGAGCDWHDLTANLTQTGNDVVPGFSGPHGRASYKTQYDDGYVSRPKDDVLREFSIIMGSGVTLGLKESIFLNDMAFRAKKYAKVGFTKKQKEWWNKIFTKACTHAAASVQT